MADINGLISRIDDKAVRLVTYVRVREIFHAYLRYQYGDWPLSLAETGRLYEAFSTSLVPNVSLYRMNYSTFSQNAFRVSERCSEEEVEDLRSDGVFLPSAKDRAKLVPFCLPHTVWFGRSTVHTNGFFQVTASGYRMMNRIIEDEFWAKFVEFDRMFSLYCYRTGLRYSQDGCIERFMQLLGMDMKFEDTFARYWRKKKESDRRSFSCFSNKEHTERLRCFFESERK